MVDDCGAMQARALLGELHGQVESISHKLHIVEGGRGRTSARGAMIQRRQSSSLRKELYEAHRLIDGLHRRFPDASPTESATR